MAVIIAALGAVFFVNIGDAHDAPYTMVLLLVSWGLLVQFLPKPQWSFRRLLWVAIALRGLICVTEPSLSDDVFRYLWEGKVLLSGGNPYVDAVSSFALDEIGQKVNHPEITSVYPPFAMGIFALCSSIFYSPLSLKLVASCADVLIVVGIHRLATQRKQSPENAWLYALHPLPIVEAASSGHLESIALLAVVMAIVHSGTGQRSQWWLFIGGGIKLFPWLLLPLARNWRIKTIGCSGLLALLMVIPFWEEGALRGLSTYAQHWSFNASIYALLYWLMGGYARWFLMAIGGLICLWVWRNKFPLDRAALWMGAAFVLLSPTVHPWYGLWVWVPALICRIPAWNLLATMLPLSYVALATLDPQTGVWSPPAWPSAVIYGSFSLYLIWGFVRQIRYPGPWASGRPTSE